MTSPICPVCSAGSTLQSKLAGKARYYRVVCVNLCARGEWAGNPHTAGLFYAQAVAQHQVRARRRKALSGGKP